MLADEPPECLGAYVISMTSKASDILAVSLLQKEAGIKNKLRVVPLFETLDDLKNAKSTMNSLFSIKWYRKYIKNEQEIMIGYSDSSKDAGKLSAGQIERRRDLVIDLIEKRIKEHEKAGATHVCIQAIPHEGNFKIPEWETFEALAP